MNADIHDKFIKILGRKVACLECGEWVFTDEDKFVLLNTLDPDNKDKGELVFFHFPCWVDYFNKRVENKARTNVQEMQSQAMQIMKHPLIAQALKEVNPSGQVESMLKTDLNKKNSADFILLHENKIDKLKKQIKKKKNGKTKRKRKM